MFSDYLFGFHAGPEFTQYLFNCYACPSNNRLSEHYLRACLDAGMGSHGLYLFLQIKIRYAGVTITSYR